MCHDDVRNFCEREIKKKDSKLKIHSNLLFMNKQKCQMFISKMKLLLNNRYAVYLFYQNP